MDQLYSQFASHIGLRLSGLVMYNALANVDLSLGSASETVSAYSLFLHHSPRLPLHVWGCTFCGVDLPKSYSVDLEYSCYWLVFV